MLPRSTALDRCCSCFDAQPTAAIAMDLDAQKRAAAARALDFVRAGMRLGLGSGTTAKHFVELLAQRVRAGLAVIAVRTSEDTRSDADRLRIQLTKLDQSSPRDSGAFGECSSRVCSLRSAKRRSSAPGARCAWSSGAEPGSPEEEGLLFAFSTARPTGAFILGLGFALALGVGGAAAHQPSP